MHNQHVSFYFYSYSYYSSNVDIYTRNSINQNIFPQVNPNCINIELGKVSNYELQVDSNIESKLRLEEKKKEKKKEKNKQYRIRKKEKKRQESKFQNNLARDPNEINVQLSTSKFIFETEDEEGELTQE